MIYPVIKQLEEKQVVIEIDLMVWSDRLDLVAFSNTKGELALHRITWTKAWSLPPPREGSLITAIAWRPDGKVIAVSYDTKDVFLINVENKKILHSIKVRAAVRCILWTQDKRNVQQDESTKPTRYMDESNTFIADPPTLANYSSNVVDDYKTSNFFQQQNQLNLLFIGTDNGTVLFNVFGCLPCVELDISIYLHRTTGREHLKTSCQIIKLHLTDDLSRLFVTTKNAENYAEMVILNTDIFKTHSDELFAIATRQEKINVLIKYLDASLTTLEEIWEGVLLEMDEKLSKYATVVPQGTLSVDFLDLLMFGIFSNEMEAFLLTDLTLKGLEKFGISIETSYANMQVLLFNHLAKAGKNICYHLIDLQGFARLEHRFKILGLCEERITAAIQAVGALLLKSGEMLHILDDTLVNSRAFIRWLTMATMQLMDEAIPVELQKKNQTDVLSIVEFLKNFDNISSHNNTSVGGKSRGGFILERLGQYLSDAPLSIETDVSTNAWDEFLRKNPCIKNNSAIIKHMPSLSLVQQHKHLKLAIASMYEDCIGTLITRINQSLTIYCCHMGELLKPAENTRMLLTQVNCGENMVMHAFLAENDTNGFYLVQTNVNIVKETIAQSLYLYIPNNSDDITSNAPEKTTITDLQFYSNSALSLLLCKKSPQQTLGVLCQLPVPLIQEKFVHTLDLARNDLSITQQNVVRVCSSEFAHNDLVGHVLEMAPRSFAVSGARKVAIVLATNRRSVRIYEMEAEEEDDEENVDTFEDNGEDEVAGTGQAIGALEGVDEKELGGEYIKMDVRTEEEREEVKEGGPQQQRLEVEGVQRLQLN